MFTECSLQVMEERMGFRVPTLVQQLAIPPLLKGKDLMVRAETGSGKTLAYMAPMMAELGERTARIIRGDGTRGLVLVPTRELCLQVRAKVRGSRGDLQGVLRESRGGLKGV
jgi:ATP-dependent RNA helicase DDX31/DBP7